MKRTERQWKEVELEPKTAITGIYTRLVGRTPDPALY